MTREYITGKLPRRKYINICPNASRSSRRLCSINGKKNKQIIWFFKQRSNLFQDEYWYSCISQYLKGICISNYLLELFNKPVKLLCSRNGICRPVSGSIYSLANPKSIIWIKCCFRVDERPIRKFSGLTLEIIKPIFLSKFIRKTYSR